MTVSSIGSGGYSYAASFAANAQRQALLAAAQAQERITTGKRINSSFDDPVSTAQIASLKAQAQAAQEKAAAANSVTTKTLLTSVQSNLSTLLSQVNTVKAAVANGDTSGIAGLVSALQSLSQTSVNGQKVFAGDATKKVDYQIKYATAATDNIITGDKLGSTVTIDGTAGLKSSDFIYAAGVSSAKMYTNTTSAKPVTIMNFTVDSASKVAINDSWTKTISSNTTKLEVLDNQGNLIKAFNPVSSPYNQTVTLNLEAGNYQLRITGDARENTTHAVTFTQAAVQRALTFNVDGKTYRVGVASGTRSTEQAVADLKAAITAQMGVSAAQVQLEDGRLVVKSAKTGANATLGGFTGQVAEAFGLTGKSSKTGYAYEVTTLAGANSALTLAAGNAAVHVANVDRYAVELTGGLSRSSTPSLADALKRLSADLTSTIQEAAAATATLVTTAAVETSKAVTFQQQITHIEKADVPAEKAKLAAELVIAQQAAFVMQVQKQHDDKIRSIFLTGFAGGGSSFSPLGIPLG